MNQPTDWLFRPDEEQQPERPNVLSVISFRPFGPGPPFQ
jgi:hypothetical protein